MVLTLPQIEKYHQIWLLLLYFVNQKTKTFKPAEFENIVLNFDHKAEHDLRKVLWNSPHLIDRFINQNPAGLSPAELEIVAGWRNFRYGDFTFCKVVRDVGIFLAHDEPQHFYAVYPLWAPFKEVLPEIPCILRTALLPYEGVIVYDGSIAVYSVRFGPGLRRAASDWYIDATERGLIKTTLPEVPLNLLEQVVQRHKANKSVLRYFKTYLRKKSLSDKIINRDIKTVEKFSDFLIRQVYETATLRDVTQEALEGFLLSMEGEISQPNIVGLKRFFTYLKETDRIDWELAEDLLLVLRSS